IVFFVPSRGFSGVCIRHPALSPPLHLSCTICFSLILGFEMFYRVFYLILLLLTGSWRWLNRSN
ncbi:MAG: hypothetical protein ACTSRA_20265, partial [Promethearchaeota archaeon]